MAQYWVSKLPITHDIDEARLQYVFLADLLQSGIFTSEASHLAKIMGEAFHPKYFEANDEKKEKLARCIRRLCDNAPDFNQACQLLGEKERENIQNAYKY